MTDPRQPDDLDAVFAIALRAFDWDRKNDDSLKLLVEIQPVLAELRGLRKKEQYNNHG